MRTAGIIFVVFASYVAGCLFPTPPDSLDFPGPYPVRSYFATFRDNIEVTVFYPHTAAPQEGFPVVIFSPGWNQIRASYDAIATELAQWGYVVIVRFYPSLGISCLGWELFDAHVEQSLALIDWCAAENARTGSPLFAKVDVSRVGMAGHSLGGSVAIAATVADERIGACVVLDANHEPYSCQRFAFPTNTAAAILYINGSAGGYCSLPVFPTANLYELTTPPTAEVVITGADHIDFLQDRIGNETGGRIVCPAGPAEPREVRAIASRYMVAWFNVYMKRLTEFEAYYHGPHSDHDEAQGLVTIRTRLERGETEQHDAS